MGPRLAQVVAPPDRRSVPAAAAAGQDRARSRINGHGVDRPALAQGPAGRPLLALPIRLEDERALSGSDDKDRAAAHGTPPQASSSCPRVRQRPPDGVRHGPASPRRGRLSHAASPTRTVVLVKSSSPSIAGCAPHPPIAISIPTTPKFLICLSPLPASCRQTSNPMPRFAPVTSAIRVCFSTIVLVCFDARIVRQGT